MKFRVRLKIGSRLGASSVYTLKELCLSIVERFSLTNKELTAIVQLKSYERFSNADLEITRFESKPPTQGPLA